MPAEVRSLAVYRLERRRASDDAERLPLAMTAHQGAVSVVLGDDVELWLNPGQARAVAADLERLATEAEALHG